MLSVKWHKSRASVQVWGSMRNLGPWTLETGGLCYYLHCRSTAVGPPAPPPPPKHHTFHSILQRKIDVYCNFLMANMIIQSTISITGYMNFFQENPDPLFIHFYLSSSIHPPYVNLIGDFAPCEEQWGNLSCCFSAGYYQDDVCFLRSLNLSKPLSFVYVYHKLKWPVNFASYDLSLHPTIPK